MKKVNEQTEYIWYLELCKKGLERRIASFESGSAYVNIQKKYEVELNAAYTECKKLKSELATTNRLIKSNREHWFEVFEDLIDEHDKKINAKNRQIEKLEKENLKLQQQLNEELEKNKELKKKYYELGAELEEEHGKNIKLTAQVNKDFQNSSIPSSSQGPKRKKIPNSREKTGRKQGGQVGHTGHRLKQRTPDVTIHLPDPEEYLNNPDYYPTGNIIKRQKIVLEVKATIKEYTATEFRNRRTGSRVHAIFPDGYNTDICYDSSVKAFAFLLANEGNMATEKIKNILRETTDGRIDISEGTINGLCREFSGKCEAEREELIRNLMTSSVMHADFTNANVNGNSKQVLVLASPSNSSTMYIARDTKGHKGVQGTPLENYVGTIVHDHDTTFYSYGLRHQECMQHNIRYLIGSIENEPNREWNKQMLSLLREMIHYMNGLSDAEDIDTATIQAYESRYDQILELAKEEYEYEPSSDYYKDGYNLYRRLVKYKESELLFLHDKSVPSNNSRAERDARVYKRKQKQMIVLRSMENFEYLCDSMSITSTLRHQNDASVYKKTKEIFSREKKRKHRFIP